MSDYLHTPRVNGRRLKMWKDPIVQEVRKVREANAKKFNYNVKNIVEDARRRQRVSNRRVVSFAIKQRKVS
jgi:hypothetical protein